MSSTTLLIIGITGILILAAISIFERTKKRRKSSEMKMRVKTLSKKIDEFLEDKGQLGKNTTKTCLNF